MLKHGSLEVKGASLSNTDWERRQWKFNGKALTTVGDDGQRPYRFTVGEMSKVRISANSPLVFSFQVDDQKVRFKANTADDAQAWCNALHGAVPCPGKSKGDDLDPELREKIRSKVKAAALAQGIGLPGLIQQMDKSGTGSIDAEHLRHRLRKVCHISKEDLPDAEFETFFNWFDTAKEGVVQLSSFEEFVDYGRVTFDHRDMGSMVSVRDSLLPTPQKERVRSKLKAALLAIKPPCPKRSQEENLRAAMDIVVQRMDKDGSGELEHSEVERAVRVVLKLPKDVISDKNILELLNDLDIDKSGSVRAEEIAAWIGPDRGRTTLCETILRKGGLPEEPKIFRVRSAPSMNPKLDAAHREKVRSKIKSSLLASPLATPSDKNKPEGQRVQIATAALVKRLDKNGSGELDLAEVETAMRKVLKISKDELPDKLMKAFFKELDADGSHTVNAQELIDFVGEDRGRELRKQMERDQEKKKQPARKWSPPRAAEGDRLTELHNYASQREHKRQQLREILEKDAENKFKDSQMRARSAGVRREQRRMPTAHETAIRLYEDHFQSQVRHAEKVRHAEEEQMQIREYQRQLCRPTGADNVDGDIHSASARLYMDAGRRFMERQYYEANQDLSPRSSSSLLGDTGRHLHLYEEATDRLIRREKRKQLEEEMELKMMADNSVHANGEGNTSRAEELHEEAQIRAQKLAKAQKEIQKKQEKDFAMMQGKIDEKDRPVPQQKFIIGKTKPPESPTKLSLVRQAEATKSKEAPPASAREVREREQAHHKIVEGISSMGRRAMGEATVAVAMGEKVGENGTARKRSVSPRFATTADTIIHNALNSLHCRMTDRQRQAVPWDVENRRLGPLLKQVMDLYSEAYEKSKADPHFAELCNMQSERLYSTRLLKDSAGWQTKTEPDQVTQVQDGLKELMASAGEAQEKFRDEIFGGSSSSDSWPPGTKLERPKTVPQALFARDPGTKSEAAAMLKATVRYGPTASATRFRHLLDLSRLQLVFQDAQSLQAGLNHILQMFETVDVRNNFWTPGVSGERSVVALVIVHVATDEDDNVPHICEMRLDLKSYHEAREKALPTLDQLLSTCRDLYAGASEDPDALVYVVKSHLSRPPMPSSVRNLRCHLATHFGSSVSAFRQATGGARTIGFLKFRELCRQLKVIANSTMFFQAVDSGLGGCVGLFELDPQSVWLMLQFRSKLMTFYSELHPDPLRPAQEGGPSGIDLVTLINGLVRSQVGRSRVPAKDKYELQEFRLLMKPLGMPEVDINKLFALLDSAGGVNASPPDVVTTKDIAWLLRLNQIVDMQALFPSTSSYAAAGRSRAPTTPRKSVSPVPRRTMTPKAAAADAVGVARSPALLATKESKDSLDASTVGRSSQSVDSGLTEADTTCSHKASRSLPTDDERQESCAEDSRRRTPSTRFRSRSSDSEAEAAMPPSKHSAPPVPKPQEDLSRLVSGSSSSTTTGRAEPPAVASSPTAVAKQETADVADAPEAARGDAVGHGEEELECEASEDLQQHDGGASGLSAGESEEEEEGHDEDFDEDETF
eukprot:TRINITY_DN44566_c0_g1_i1.p1 TRINITY_DN44566_c0_g1~~TRINITY_DN44566_c0_g1_i1.p1  ORF type:complete len:1544 (+),score=463.77 TRINITY_DN44566_c0_g1_i1:119-4750(+)